MSESPGQALAHYAPASTECRCHSPRLHSRRHARSLQPTMGATTARQVKGSGSLPARQRRLDGRSATLLEPMVETMLHKNANFADTALVHASRKTV